MIKSIVEWIKGLMPCNHEYVTIYAIEYEHPVEWEEVDHVSAFATFRRKKKSLSGNYISIRWCPKCGDCRVGVMTPFGPAAYSVEYVGYLLFGLTNKTIETIIFEYMEKKRK